MALQQKSAGDSATPGSVATTGTSSLDQARDARPAGAFFVGQVAEDLEQSADQLRELSELLIVITGLIDDGVESSVSRANTLLSMAGRRLYDITSDIDTTRDGCAREATQMGVAHG